jgi:hypothetical protein
MFDWFSLTMFNFTFNQSFAGCQDNPRISKLRKKEDKKFLRTTQDLLAFVSKAARKKMFD